MNLSVAMLLLNADDRDVGVLAYCRDMLGAVNAQTSGTCLYHCPRDAADYFGILQGIPTCGLTRHYQFALQAFNDRRHSRLSLARSARRQIIVRHNSVSLIYYCIVYYAIGFCVGIFEHEQWENKRGLNILGLGGRC